MKNVIIGLGMLLVSAGVFAAPGDSKVTSWEAVKLDVASKKNRQFSKSISAFVRENREPPYWLTYERVNGDADGEINLNGLDVAHVKGHLKTNIVMQEHAELVVAGDVYDDIIIEADGINSIYVGGSFYGTIKSTNSLRLVVKGDFEGNLVTGRPVADLEINGDYKGIVKHDGNRGSLVYMAVDGHITDESINALTSQNYTELHVRAGYSDIPQGIHYIGRALVVVKH